MSVSIGLLFPSLIPDISSDSISRLSISFSLLILILLIGQLYSPIVLLFSKLHVIFSYSTISSRFLKIENFFLTIIVIVIVGGGIGVFKRLIIILKLNVPPGIGLKLFV